MVRVRLAGRRVRGFVVGMRSGDRAGLREVDAVSGDAAVFDARLLETLRWAAIHYVAPLSVMLAKTAPPNLPRGRIVDRGTPPRSRPRLRALVGGDPCSLAAAAAADGGLLVLAPTVVEAGLLTAAVAATAGQRLFAAAGATAAAVTEAWVAAKTRPDCVLVATREAVWWPIPGRRVLVVDEARRGMQDKQTPMVKVSDVVRRRGLVEGVETAFWSAAPSVDLAAHGIEPSAGMRPWPQVQIVDRSGDGSVLAATTVAAIRSVARGGERCFCFARSRGYSPAVRCTRCGGLHRCPTCAASLPPAGSCLRCGTASTACTGCGGRRFNPIGVGAGRLVEELARYLGPAAVGPAGSGRTVEVGTERDLPAAGGFALAVVADADGMLGAPHYQAEEQALHLLVRIARLVVGRGRRAVVQSYQPDHRVLTALRTAKSGRLTTAWLTERERDGLPPHGQLLVVELTDAPESADERLRAAAEGRAAVHAQSRDGRSRWMLQGRDLRAVRVALRSMVQEWRDMGARVRVEVDPRRL